MNSKKHRSPGSEVMVHRVDQTPGGRVVSGTLAAQGTCPDCGLCSKRRHGWRRLVLQDFPAHGDAVTVDLRVCRWRCLSTGCRCGTLSDQEPSIALRCARRTSRTAQIAKHMGHATGGRPAERLMHRLGMPISDDAILRHLKRGVGDIDAVARIIGIHDWSWRK